MPKRSITRGSSPAQATGPWRVGRGLGPKLAGWFIRLVLPLSVLATVLAVFLGERASITHEVQIVAPEAGAPGARLPIRALIFAELAQPGGPRLVSAPVRVRLRDGEQVVGRARLAPSVVGGAEGSVQVPSSLAASQLTLEAVAYVRGEPVAKVERRLEIDEAPRPAELRSRRAHAVRLFDLGAIRPLADAAPPVPFEVRVVGGACVPEARCEILVHVGHPAAAVRIAPTEWVAVEEPSEPGETTGIVRIPVVVRGPEGHVVLQAFRRGEPVAQRNLQLPVAFATPAIELASRTISPEESPRLRVSVLRDHPGIIVDAYQDGVWRWTGSLPLPRSSVPAPVGPLEPGLWRLQVRTDPFSAEHAAVRMIATNGVSDALARIEELGGDPFAPSGTPEDRFAWSAASVESAHRALPEPASGFAADEARLSARQARLRVAAFVALAVGLAVLGGALVRRGVESAQEAQRVMDATGDVELASARHRRRTLLSALAIVATVLLAFLGAMALIVARAHLLE